MGDGDNEYLYLVFDFRDINSIQLCQVTPTANPVLDQLTACCDCATCPAGDCTEYGIDFVSGPNTTISYVDCAGVSQSVVFTATAPNNKISICAFPETGFTVNNQFTEFNHSITDCACV